MNFLDLTGLSRLIAKIKDGTLVAGRAVADSNGDNIAEKYLPIADGVETIIGTQAKATGAWTGVSRLATASDMVSGYKFCYWLPYAYASQAGGATLTLTFQDDTTKTIDLYFSGASRLTSHFGAGNKLDFVYLEDARINTATYTGAWVARGYDSSNDYNLQSVYERRFIYDAEMPLYRYKLCGFNKGKVVPLVITNQTSATIVDKTPVTAGIDPTKGLVHYNTTGAVTAVGTTFASLWYEQAITTCVYTFNDDVPAYVDVYLKGSIGSDGLFYLDTTTHKSWYVFAPNRASDGLYTKNFVKGAFYMFVGTSYSSVNYLQLKYNNPLFYYNGTALVPMMPKVMVNNVARVGGTKDQFLMADGSVLEVLALPTPNPAEYIEVLGPYLPTPEPGTTPEPSTPEPLGDLERLRPYVDELLSLVGSTPEPSTPEPSTPEPSTPEPSTPEPSTPERTTPGPVEVAYVEGGTEYDLLYDGQEIPVPADSYSDMVSLEAYDGREFSWYITGAASGNRTYQGSAVVFEMGAGTVDVYIANENASHSIHVTFVRESSSTEETTTTEEPSTEEATTTEEPSTEEATTTEETTTTEEPSTEEATTTEETTTTEEAAAPMGNGAMTQTLSGALDEFGV